MRRRTTSTGDTNRSDRQLPGKSRNWDSDQRNAAWELDRSEPRWVVFYGPYTRRFYAIAAWPSPSPIVLDAEGTAELRELMHEADAAPGLAGGLRTA